MELHALVYGDLTANGIAGGLAGEYAGSVFLTYLPSVRALTIIPAQSPTDPLLSLAVVYGSCPTAIFANEAEATSKATAYMVGSISNDCSQGNALEEQFQRIGHIMSNPVLRPNGVVTPDALARRRISVDL